MKTIKMLIGAAVAAASLTTVSLGIANADVDSTPYGGGSMGDSNNYAFRNMLVSLNEGDITPAAAGEVGVNVCTVLNLGKGEEFAMYGLTQSGFPEDVAELAMHGAEYHYCPDHF